MPRLVPTIGLEIHAELKTRTKMFCDCLNDPEERNPNVNVCPVCLGHPGALPTINGEAVKKVIAVGLALGGNIGNISKFDRKSYFYPDLPKAYQISQYDEPLVSGGSLKNVRLTRIHLEEDTGRLSHQLPGNTGRDQDYSYVDFNRSSLPLMELVTEPDISSAEQAVDFAKELQLILRYLGASDADMEKGQMRVEANLSVAEPGAPLGTKVEVKNLNSFRAVREAIKYEVERQTGIVEGGGKVVQETRGWDERGVTVSQRIKEEAHDYRYMPDPDLPPLSITEKEIDAIKEGIKQLPDHIRKELQDFHMSENQIEVIVSDPNFADYALQTAKATKKIDPDIFESHSSAVLGAYLTNNLLALMNDRKVIFADLKISSDNFAQFVVYVAKGKVGSNQAKAFIVEMFDTGADPKEILKDSKFTQVNDESELSGVVEKVIASTPKAVSDYKQGKTSAIEALVGRAMGELKGRGNPELLRKLFEDRLSK